MSYKTARRLRKIADLLEKAAHGLLNCIELVMVDAAWGKNKYRKRAARTRPIVQKTVIIRPSAPRVVVVKEKA